MAMSVVYSNAFGGVFAENRGGTVSIYVPDTQGSTIGLVGSAGVLTDRWVYWPYGEVASRTGTNVTPLTWLGTLGYYLDQVSKLFYVRARHLRADLARWLTVDPLWPGQPAYEYAESAPTMLADPWGASTGGGGPITAPLPRCCNAWWSYNITKRYVLGILVGETITFQICLCCCDTGWAAITAFTAVIAAVIAYFCLPCAGAAGVIAAGIVALWAWCWERESGARTCVGYSGTFFVSPPLVWPPLWTYLGGPNCC